MSKSDEGIRHGTDNVFADLGYADPDTHLLKAQLVGQVIDIIRGQRFTQAQAAKLLGLSQPDVSRLLKGQFRDISVERIMRMLTRLGCNIDIVVTPQAKAHLGGVMHFHMTPPARP